jgi:steroid delta-isomerase-like uncharacterized protein
MSEENKALVRRAYDELANEGNLAVADETFAPNFVRHDLAAAQDVVGPEGVKQFIAAFRGAFPDLRFTIEDMVAEGDKVAVRSTFRGTHKGQYQGIAPTGKQVTFAGINIYRAAGGRVTEAWALADGLGLMQQLGVIPAMGQGG